MEAGSLCANLIVQKRDGVLGFIFEHRFLTVLPGRCVGMTSPPNLLIFAKHYRIGYSLMIWDDNVVELRAYCERPADAQ